MSEVYVGIDLGGTNIKFGVFGADMELMAKDSILFNIQMQPPKVIEQMAAAIEKILGDNGLGLDDVAYIGWGNPGPAKYKEGIIEAATNLPKFRNTPVAKMLSERLGKPVVFENDANVACWGEHTCGAGKGVDDMIFFTLGTGIGGGIINKGKLLIGCGDNAAELGHLIIYGNGRQCNCGQRGCAEAYGSASHTARRATEELEAGAESSLQKIYKEKGEVTCKEIFDAMKAGDAFAEKIVDGTCEALAILCINCLHFTEPSRIVFAGGMINAGEVLLKKIREQFEKHIWHLRKEPVEICFATLGEDAGIIGAAALARQMNTEGS
jgi:glucokinase